MPFYHCLCFISANIHQYLQMSRSEMSWISTRTSFESPGFEYRRRCDINWIPSDRAEFRVDPNYTVRLLSQNFEVICISSDEKHKLSLMFVKSECILVYIKLN